MHFVQAKGILSQNNGMNIYRGCSHGCIYCDSRSKCYGFTHAFEDIEVKGNAPELLEQALRSKRHRCMIGTGAMCDPYLPAEKELRLTRKCLELIDQYEYGVTVLTKASLVLRDLDLLQSINQKAKAVVQMTFTTYDEDLCRKIEPNVSTTRERFEVLMKCKELGIPTLVWMTPILPFINDTRENRLIPQILHQQSANNPAVSDTESSWAIPVFAKFSLPGSFRFAQRPIPGSD